MLRPLDSLLLGIAALLVSAGLLLAAVPAPPETVAADCPYAALRIVA